MAHPKAAFGPRLHAPRTAATAVLVFLAAGWLAAPAAAQNFPITPTQRSTAEQVAQAGVPLGDLVPNAPEEYTVKRGDTLWAISGLYLSRPWRWPELWGMNLQEVRNPHRIYPGQQLVLEKLNGRAVLRMRQASGSLDGSAPTDTVRVSPRTRYATLADAALPALAPHLIEPFLAEPAVVDADTLKVAPRIVATQEGRVLISRGDRAYALGSNGSPFVESDTRRTEEFRVFRDAVPLKDPVTQTILGYEAQYLGKAALVRSESVRDVPQRNGGTQATVVPATIDIISAKEEMRVGDRLLPEPARQLLSYIPHAPDRPTEGRVVSVYGSTVGSAGQNQVVVINKGTADGMESGHVLAILKDGARVVDRTQPGQRVDIKLPDERNGLMMVFRPFERVSYALILQITDGVQVGDRVVNPR